MSESTTRRSARRLSSVLVGTRYRPFWTMLIVRTGFWVGTTLTLLWTQYSYRSGERDLTSAEFQAYESRTDVLFNTFTEWDAGWFIGIAANGYFSTEAAAFFPLYPLVVGAVSDVTGSIVVAGVVISLIAAGVAAVLIAEIASTLLNDRVARDSVLYVALYPLAFVFTSVYSEGLFLALAAGAILAALRDRPVLAGVLGALAVATRPTGLALVPALAILLWPRTRSVSAFASRLAPLLLLPAVLGLYALYLEDRLGDALAFVRAQEAVGWRRELATLGPIGGLWEGVSEGAHGALEILLHLPAPGELASADLIGTRNALQMLLLAAALALTWVAWRRLGAAFGVYSASLIAIAVSAPAELYPLVSFPRYLLADFPLFIALAALTERRPSARDAVIVTFAAVGAAAAVGFARHVWIA